MKPSIREALIRLRQAERLDMWEAAKLLAGESDAEAETELIGLLNDATDFERRIAAAWTLGFMHASAAASGDGVDEFLRQFDFRGGR